MLSFSSDYTQGCVPEILNKLREINYEMQPGYGTDPFCDSAKRKIREACGVADAQVEFLVGGTQTNKFVISALLHSTEGVIAAVTGHVNVHEAGAIETSGHKVLAIPEHNGKMDPEELKAYVEAFYADGDHEHMVYPGMVYISHPTEYGTLYTREELGRIHEICASYDMPLFVDGARLGYGLCSYQTDVTMKDLAANCDVFYIGGTKVGALFGEAVVFTGKYRPRNVVTQIKQNGALLAKGWLLGVQFDCLFTDDLYTKAGENAISKAEEIKRIFAQYNIPRFLDSPTNQQFFILENGVMETLKQQVNFTVWGPYDKEHTIVRFVASWATTDENIKELEAVMTKVFG